MSKETREEIQKLLDSIGAVVEMVSFLRDQLIDHGFTRKEAVLICSNVISNSFTKSGRNEESEE